tara:strand:- start:3602 stop:3934 length:333 start_codon:yes stop_codon:yes gene_type:complete
MAIQTQRRKDIMAFAPSSTHFDQDATILGCFREKDTGNIFEFSSIDPDHTLEGVHYPHKVWVTTPWEMDCGYRYAIVKKTVVYIVTDIDGSDEIVMEKWNIKDFRQYTAK